MIEKYPILYSFRRCPYAIRARFAIKYSRINCLLREVDLKNKPKELLDISPKGTVPVLVLKDGRVLEESLNIVNFALKISDPDNYLALSEEEENLTKKLIEENDQKFTKILHRYKYPDAHPEDSPQSARKDMLNHLAKLDSILEKNRFLISNKPSVSDIAIFPFVRQVDRIDHEKFLQFGFKNLIAWLDFFYKHPAYQLCMKKFSKWSKGPGDLF